MHNFQLLISFLIFYGIRFSCFAQQSISDSTIQLKEFEVTANRLENFSSGTKIQKIDSATFAQYKTTNLANLLENESSVFIKTYGLGNLAVSSFRGGNANHTTILWNGFNLNSPMNGQFDLSLFPNSFTGNVHIQHGGTSALWGSGAVGGAIHLNNEGNFKSGIKVAIGSSFGSFENYRQNAEVEISKEKWVSSLKFFNHFAKNDFEFYNIQQVDSPLQKQKNAALKQFGFLYENYFRINHEQKINFRFWHQNNARNIPPSMLQKEIDSGQKDESYRITSEWLKSEEKISYFFRTAFFDEQLIYSVPSLAQKFYNRSQTLIAETESKIQLHKNHFLNLGINNTYVNAVSDGYPHKPQQNRVAAFASYRVNSNNKNVAATFSARQELMEKTLIPFTFSLGSEYKIFHWISAKATVSKVYRVPTFNDLFWIPGGNPNLLPENGYSEDAGVLFKPFSSGRKIDFSFEPTLFNRRMNNWILWLPGQSYWSPQNILEVWSRGMETKSELVLSVNKIKFRINVLTNYVVSTNEKPSSENDNSIDKQLIYVPMYSGHAKFSVGYKNFLFSCNQNYTGYRYTSTDNYEYLEPFMLTNMYASYKMIFKKYSVNFFAQANNFLNEQYQVILNRPMPLRNYQAGISIQFNNSNHNH